MWCVLQNQFHVKDSVKNNSKIHMYVKYIYMICKNF